MAKKGNGALRNEQQRGTFVLGSDKRKEYTTIEEMNKMERKGEWKVLSNRMKTSKGRG